MRAMDARVSWAVGEIEANLSSELDVPALAAAVNLSPSRFAHLFRRDTGLSPARFVRQRRLDRASVLLESTFLSVKEVMVAVGINDASHFARVFREHHGVSPREWRTARRSALTALEVAATVKRQHAPTTDPANTLRHRLLPLSEAPREQKG